MAHYTKWPKRKVILFPARSVSSQLTSFFFCFSYLIQPLAQSSKDKKFEESIQDLQFQILYGDTATNIQLGKLTDTHLTMQQQHQYDKMALLKLKQKLAKHQEEKVEQWLLKDNNFTTAF